VPRLDPHLSVERNVQCWFAPSAADAMQPSRLPVFAVERSEWPFMLYGFPDFGDGVKCAFHHSGTLCDPETLERRVIESDVRAVRTALREWIPGAAGPLRNATACTYTLTADERFVIGPLPFAPPTIVAGGFSGHGFKFCSVVGEIVADLIEQGGTGWDIGMFAPARLECRSAS
jgi:sarcosine oxidase